MTSWRLQDGTCFIFVVFACTPRGHTRMGVHRGMIGRDHRDIIDVRAHTHTKTPIHEQATTNHPINRSTDNSSL